MLMRRILSVATLSLGCFLFSDRGAVGEELATLSLDDHCDIGCVIETDSESKVEGKASVKITTKWPATICLGEVKGPTIEEAQLVYTAKVKTSITGAVGLELWAHVGGGQYFSRDPTDIVTGESDWKELKIPFYFQKGQQPEKVTLNLMINGKGTVWVDDIKLSKAPLPHQAAPAQ